MKYIRSYNESNLEGLNEEEVIDFCETHLAYLLDDGLKVLVSTDDLKALLLTFGKSDYKVTLSFRLVANKRWIDIKDQVIPFLTHLRNEYELEFKHVTFGSYNLEFNIVTEGYGSYPEFFNIDQVILDNVDSHRLNDDYRVLSIRFKIKGEKV